MKRSFLVIVIFSLLSCENRTENEHRKAASDNMLGAWKYVDSDPELDNASFAIERDSIFYVEDLKRYKYERHGNTLTIHIDNEEIDTFIYKMRTDDTLVVLTSSGPQVYVRNDKK